MSEYVWMLNPWSLADSALLPDFLLDLPGDAIDPEFGVHPQEAIAQFKKKGALLPDKFIPEKIISRYSDSKVNLERDVIKVAALIGVSARIHDVIKEFDYGSGGGFHLVTPYRKGKLEKPLGEPYYVMNFAGNKMAVLPKSSQHMHFESGPDLWGFSGDKDNELVVSRVSLEGPDVWVEPQLAGSHLFFSRRLGDAIKAAKPKSRIYMRKCRVEQG